LKETVHYPLVSRRLQSSLFSGFKLLCCTPSAHALTKLLTATLKISTKDIQAMRSQNPCLCYTVLEICWYQNFHFFIHFHARLSSGKGRGGSSLRRTRNNSRFSSISDRTAGSTLRRRKARSEM